MQKETQKTSPKWSNTTKLVVSLIIVTFFMGLLISFRSMVMPIIIAILLAYLLQPVAAYLSQKLKISWRFTVIIIYLFLLIIIVGLLTWGGFAIVEQFQNLLNFLQRVFEVLPDTLANLSQTKIQIGAFEVDFATYEIDTLVEQALTSISPILTRTGSLIGNIASGAATTIAMTLFILLISHFILSGTRGGIFHVVNVDIPGYNRDLQRIGEELGRIWHAFLRGQLLIMALTFIVYLGILNILGINFPVELALLASIARLLPYIGPAIAWTVYGLVAIFQANTPFNLPPVGFAVLVIGTGLLLDSLLDNLVVPKIYSDVLKLHPAMILVGAIVAASWLGLVGALLAAPTIASTILILRYALRKLFDIDPWINLHPEQMDDIGAKRQPSFIEKLYNKLKTNLSDQSKSGN